MWRIYDLGETEFLRDDHVFDRDGSVLCNLIQFQSLPKIMKMLNITLFNKLNILYRKKTN